MQKKVSKAAQMLILSEEILGNLEDENLSFEKTISKCKKLARMRGDFEALDWFTVELCGYGDKDLPLSIRREDLDKFAIRSGRTTIEIDPSTKKEVTKYWIASITELEVQIQSYVITLENLKPPSQFTPALSSYSSDNNLFGKSSNTYVVEKYKDVIAEITVQSNNIISQINHAKTLITKVRNNVYDYVLNINLQLKFENITESIFQTTKERIDKELTKICPESMKKFVAAYERLKSANPEEWSQALSSCRNILKDFADYIFPATNTPYVCRDGKKISVTDDKYKNRLLAFIDQKYTSNKRKLLMARTADLESRIHALNDILSQGTHGDDGLDSIDVNICVIDTYLLIGSLMSTIDLQPLETT
jgi:hypothetical protein